ncbi:MAG: nickel pincer cofactor biosynthesis protein LarC [Armatimonadetes bacterium]|nr:nickel pincer cofactor biosynthesis protein LarC [Armatimonadota bacterium]MCX7968548.1 nickel pincer cofactor biosynthesis protein LarC [Armatimonadota bacterium]MDW8142179.1 nickel pincer cofactor biosynthesis protein LarC [Armatimonadota bacterium]
MEVAYFDCFAGVSGDMALGAILDAGAPLDKILEGLKTLPLKGWDLRVERVRKGLIESTSVTVLADEHHPERRLADIELIISDSDLPEAVKTRSTKIFHLLAQVEAKVHGTRVDEVHFHEVGAVDSIIDIVGVVYALYLLGVREVYSSALPFSRGRVKTAHGELPVPAPATMELLCGIPTYPLDIDSELVTPTGAALLKGLAKSFGSPPPFTPKRVGYGAGKKDLPFPNVLRVVVGEMPDDIHLERERLTVIETNLDDMTGELVGFVVERLFEAGARDVWVTPAQMKKNRPAVVLSVLCDSETLPAALQILLRETTTLGVRVQEVERLCLPREFVEVETPYGVVKVKVAKLGNEIVNIAPEYEDCREVALKQKVPLKEVVALAIDAAHQKLQRRM